MTKEQAMQKVKDFEAKGAELIDFDEFYYPEENIQAGQVMLRQKDSGTFHIFTYYHKQMEGKALHDFNYFMLTEEDVRLLAKHVK